MIRVKTKENGAKAYKGFNADMTCRGFRYEEGRTYKTKDAKVCERGFHACEHPLGCLSYYGPATSVYHEVELGGKIDGDNDGTKTAATEIRIGARLGIADLVKAAIDFTMARIRPKAKADEEHGAASATGYRGAASTTGCDGAASATGYRGVASATGDGGAASATGSKGAASATGSKGAASATNFCGAASATNFCGAASATGDGGAASATGDVGAASATGDGGAASATGDSGAASATGDVGAASATGDGGAASATGSKGAASATGFGGTASATGYKGAASATGYRGVASATGDGGAASTTGCGGAASAGNATAIAVAWGPGSRAKGVKGARIVLSEWKRTGGEYDLIDAKMVRVDGKKIKADTWYILENGTVREFNSGKRD